jgi:hypothetical protein
VTFHDLRGTAVTRLALAGCTELEIADITGHSVGGVKAILDRRYLCRDGSLADNAIRKLSGFPKTLFRVLRSLRSPPGDSQSD